MLIYHFSFSVLEKNEVDYVGSHIPELIFINELISLLHGIKLKKPDKSCGGIGFDFS